MIQVTIKENSWFAKRAARYLHGYAAAIVFGKTIHLYNSTKENFLKDTAWVRHEIAHVKQYERLGFVRFILIYVLETWRKGYYNNKLEVEARKEEGNPAMLNGIIFLS